MNQLGRVLIIDDEEILRRTLGRVLRKAGYEVDSAGDGRQALQMLESDSYQLAYLDIRLPGMDGMEILKEIRRRDLQLAVILLTAYGSLQTALEALRLGATDYLLKPIDPEVLLARTRVILQEQADELRKRQLRQQIAQLQRELRQLEQDAADDGPLSNPVTSPNPYERFLKTDSLVLDLQTRRITFRDRVISLPPTTFDYLVVLARHAPDVVSYQNLVSEAQGYETELVEARELAKWHIHTLRQAFEETPSAPQYLINVRGIGYRWVKTA